MSKGQANNDLFHVNGSLIAVEAFFKDFLRIYEVFF
jgi:hypothetical protein